MTHYVLIDGVLQRSTSETQRWAKRVARAVPRDTEEPRDTAVTLREHTEYEVLEGLKETE